jgi:hypothetical protein
MFLTPNSTPTGIKGGAAFRFAGGACLVFGGFAGSHEEQFDSAGEGRLEGQHLSQIRRHFRLG